MGKGPASSTLLMVGTLSILLAEPPLAAEPVEASLVGALDTGFFDITWTSDQTNLLRVNLFFCVIRTSFWAVGQLSG